MPGPARLPRALGARAPSRPRGWLSTAVLCLAALAIAPAPGRADERTHAVLHVGAAQDDGYLSIQAALDAAPAGAVVRIAPGTYSEHVRITRPVTLEGAGPEATRLVSILYRQCNLMALRRSYLPRIRTARSDAEKKRLRAALREREATLIQPTLLVEDAEGVTLRNLRLSGRGQREGSAIGFGEVIQVRGAEVAIEDSAIVGSPGCGIRLRNGARARLTRVLVAGVWDRGIVIGHDDETVGRVVVQDCDVRTCYHQGIAIEAGCNDVRIEGCRISGSAWHGIRYDDSSPTIRGNLIFDNQRMGIYAAGETAGEVTGNLVFRNRLGGMTCRQGSRDRVERNTFANNGGEGLVVLGTARPRVGANIFATMPIGVLVGLPGSVRTLPPDFVLRGNLFWQCSHPVWARERMEPDVDGDVDDGRALPLPPDGGNATEDPGLVVEGDLLPRLDAKGTAASRGVGPPSPAPALPGPWPTQPEEEDMQSALDLPCESTR